MKDNKYMKVTSRAWVFCLAAVSILGLPGQVWAQASFLGSSQEGGLSGLGGGDQDIVKANAQFTTPTAKQPARLFITAEIKIGWHIYSITQAPGGPIRTQIKLDQSPQYRLLGAFQARESPKKEKEPKA